MVRSTYCSICRSKYNEYPEYHTSLDNLDFVSPEGLQGAFDVYSKIILFLENNKTFECTIICEPQLGKRGLYPTISDKRSYNLTRDMMNLIAYADGNNTLLEIATILNISMERLIPIAQNLCTAGILRESKIL